MKAAYCCTACSSADLIRAGVGFVCLGIFGVLSEACRIDCCIRCGWPSLQLIPTERATKQPMSNELGDQKSQSAPPTYGVMQSSGKGVHEFGPRRIVSAGYILEWRNTRTRNSSWERSVSGLLSGVTVRTGACVECVSRVTADARRQHGRVGGSATCSPPHGQRAVLWKDKSPRRRHVDAARELVEHSGWRPLGSPRDRVMHDHTRMGLVLRSGPPSATTLVMQMVNCMSAADGDHAI